MIPSSGALNSPDTSGHKNCALFVPAGVPEDLAEIVASWDSLPEALKADILAKVREAVRE